MQRYGFIQTYTLYYYKSFPTSREKNHLLRRTTRLKDELRKKLFLLTQMNNADTQQVIKKLRKRAKKVDKKRTLGFTSEVSQTSKEDKNNLFAKVTHEDIRNFGMIPEILGRLPILTYLDELDRTAIRNILTEPKNALVKQYKELFKIDGIELTFTKGALDYIADKAMERKLGARGAIRIQGCHRDGYSQWRSVRPV